MAKATKKNLYLDRPSMHVDDYDVPVVDQISNWMKDMKLIREFVRRILLEQTGNIQSDLIAKYGVDLRIYEEPELITLSKIIVPDTMRGQGIGSKVMLDLTDYADLKGKIIATTPSADFGGKKSGLLKFYRSFDFIPNKGRNKVWETMETMIRLPR